MNTEMIIRLQCLLSEAEWEQCEAFFESLEPLALTLEDAKDTPLYQAGTEAITQLWPCLSVSLYFPGSIASEKKISIMAWLSEYLPHVTCTESDIDPHTPWLEQWQQQNQPIYIHDKLIIYPSAPTDLPKQIPSLLLEPGMAFGTGQHPTTYLCLQRLADLKFSGALLDLGCGSGILGLAAYQLGAQPVYAIDIDEQAIQSATHNALCNGINFEQKDFFIGTPIILEKSGLPGFSVIVANILLNTLLDLQSFFEAHLAPQGILILSGILEEQVVNCQSGFGSNWTWEAPLLQAGWACLTGRRKS